MICRSCALLADKKVLHEDFKCECSCQHKPPGSWKGKSEERSEGSQ